MKVKSNVTIILLGIFLAWGLNHRLVFAADKYLIPGDARKGWHVLSAKGCIQCHGVSEKGRTIIAPDLSKSPSGHLSSAGLAADRSNACSPRARRAAPR